MCCFCFCQPHPQLIGTLIKFKQRTSQLCKVHQAGEESSLIQIFRAETCLQRCLTSLHLEHSNCSRLGLNLEENQLPVSPETPAALFHTTKCKNLSDPEQKAVKDHLLVHCTPSPTDTFKLPLGTYNVTTMKYSVSLRTVKRIWYQYKETGAKNN